MNATTGTIEQSRTDFNWAVEPLRDLIAHIKTTHHEYVRREIPHIRELAAKVAGKHGIERPELPKIHATFEGLADELTSHMMKEERMLFPFIEHMEEAAETKTSLPFSPFGTVRNPVAIMKHEHADADNALSELRRLTGDYTAPPDSCECPTKLYALLAEFEADLHRHIHLENEILFPRAIELEQTL